MIDQNPQENQTSRAFALETSLVAAAALFVVFGFLRSEVVNVVTYELAQTPPAPAWLTYWPPALGAFIIICPALLARRQSPPGVPLLSSSASAHTPVSPPLAAAPALITIAIAILWLAGLRPTVVVAGIAIATFAWAADRLWQRAKVAGAPLGLERAAPWILAIAIVGATAWHAAEQISLWRHFMLGYADFGRFTTALENCLPWKDVGPARFSHPLMATHFVPLFYALVPLYAVFRSPAFLMVVGPLVLNVAAVAFYRYCSKTSGSRLTGLLVALAWIALPSVTRLPYSNTYGFQTPYLAVPLLAFAMTLRLDGKRRASWLLLAAAALCQETVCGVIFGWGCYLLIRGNRREGAVTALAALGYLALCTLVIIPAFAGGGSYERLSLFGDLTAASILDRLSRGRVWLYLGVLVFPLLPRLVRGAGVLIAAVPTLALIVLLQQADYLNIKYWHQATVLPVLFLAAATGIANHRASANLEKLPSRNRLGASIVLLASVLMFQQLLGLSPVSRAYQLFANQPPVSRSDPRHVVVEKIRAGYAPNSTVVIATQRLAAHFIDYRMVYTLGNVALPAPSRRTQILIIDTADRWDPVIAAGEGERYVEIAEAAGFVLIDRVGPILVLRYQPPVMLQPA